MSSISLGSQSLPRERGRLALGLVDFDDPALCTRLSWFFVILGAALRIARYVINPPIWGDEAFVAASFIDRGFLDLLRPLEYHQVAPLFFLWAEWAAVRLLGFSEWSLRLFPVLCGLASLVVFRHIAARVLSGLGMVLAVATFAVSFYLVRHAGEIKPYSADLLAALGLLALAVEWARDRERSAWLWALVLAVPFALGFSYPAVFVAGGIGLGLTPAVWRAGWRSRVPFALFGLATAVTFVALYLLVSRHQAVDVDQGMKKYWAAAFPPVGSPWKLLVWLIDSHTSHMVSYPVGGASGASTLTTVLIAIGVRNFLRLGRGTLLAVFLTPLGLGLLAAFLRLYPYGGSARTMQYIAPAVCLLASQGAARILESLPWPRLRARSPRLALVVLTGIGLIPTALFVARPYKDEIDRKARDFARHFWAEQEQGGVPVCVHHDLGITLEERHWREGRTAVYLCNQKIYSPRHRRGASLPWDRVSAAFPLRCVLYNEEPIGTPAFDAWLRGMGADFEQTQVHRYAPFPKALIKGLWFEDSYAVYEFVPRAGSPARPIAFGSIKVQR